ncbi:putative sensor domain DACNV-containing protein [Sphingomonas sp. G-3-2-10]|uniref:putative sensor domain DACNV-containing protein n=1 Tax=Sphingomonas sp. G-3-2-10 TaxID=2728838 RepID=UPI00146A6F33|nr:hypothetical protein [Sphingomonas sp. G-3-2-10]NML07303.1 hypothetical protein [Sphingomonas sp. G-3-2-10]
MREGFLVERESKKTAKQIDMAKFPKDLAKSVFESWDNIVSGEYVAPVCPSQSLLKQILEACYIAAGSPDEGRYPRFNVMVTEENFSDDDRKGAIYYRFSKNRAVCAEEIRRLAPATDFKKSAIWIMFNTEECYVAGVCDLGTSWHRARLGLSYSYQVPPALLVQVDRPGKIKVYQGEFAIASLTDGKLVTSRIDIPFFLHTAAHDGFENIARHFTVPEIEEPREFEDFWFTALCNVFSAIANSISALEHGGLLVIISVDSEDPLDHVRMKYPCESSALRDAFVQFINARNTTADFWCAVESGLPRPGDAQGAELILANATERLVEAIRFVAQLSGCDGAILLTTDLKLLGFGAEIRAEMASDFSVSEVTNELSQSCIPCDIEQFGMRHRSAIKLVSKLPKTCVLAVSQDGPVSAVWAGEKSIMVRKGVPLGNMNIPWA